MRVYVRNDTKIRSWHRKAEAVTELTPSTVRCDVGEKGEKVEAGGVYSDKPTSTRYANTFPEYIPTIICKVAN